jgi:flavin-dependent dehydrogenase
MAAEILVIGGGVAGAAAAIELARAGRQVVLLEREAGPHDKVCGEFLSREAILYLRALGLDPGAMGARRIGRLRLAGGRRVAGVRLPFQGFSLSRRLLDAALLDRAAALGVEVRTGAAAQGLTQAGSGFAARLRDGEEITAAAAILATGKHDLRGHPRPPGLQPGLIGFKQYWRLAPEQASSLEGHVELMLFAGGYAGLQLVEDGRANLCLLIKRERFAALGHDWDALIANMRSDCRLLDERLRGAAPCGDRPLAVYAVPFGHIARGGDAVWRIGDQAAVIPSFSGDGMSIALHSARLAAQYLLAGRPAMDYQQHLARDISWPLRLATGISMAAISPAGRLLVGQGASRVPALMAVVAAITRVPSAALRRSGLEIEEERAI